MKPTLFVLAAGMGSRYGGLKQLDGLGPNGETIMDYSIYDAIQAGFGKVVFVIRHCFEKDFLEIVVSKFKDVIPVEIVFQELDVLPSGFTLNKKREKPWGTNHAVLMGKSVIKEPFAVINADDFYGAESFKVVADFLKSVDGKKKEYCVIGYHLGNTLSESGGVNRGVCAADKDGYLTTVVERLKIEDVGGKIQFEDETGAVRFLTSDTLVSMNMWGFTPDYFDYSEVFFKEFLTKNENDLKAECYIPTVVNAFIQSGEIKVKVLETPSKWFGVTYPEDRAQVVMNVNSLVRQGLYPEKLWNNTQKKTKSS